MSLAQNQKTYHSIVYGCQYHVVWCPKYRRKLLVDPIDKRLKDLILEKQTHYRYNIISMEIMPDHVHLLVDVDPRIGIQEVVTKIKGFTAFQLRKEFPFLKAKTPTP